MTERREEPVERGIYRRDGVLWIRYTDHDGVLRRQKVGPSIAKAREAYRRAKTEAIEVRAGVRPRPGADITFAAWVAEYGVLHGAEMASWPRIVGFLAQCCNAWNPRRLRDITTQDVNRVTAEMKQRGMAPGSIQLRLAQLSSVFGAAVKAGIIQSNPVSRAVKPRVENGRIRFFTEEEAALILANAREEWRIGIDFALNSGIRHGEQCRLRKRDFDLDHRRAFIERGKDGKLNYCYFPQKMVASLERHLAELDDEDVVFTLPDSGPFTALLRRLGIENASWHTLRHTFASWLAQRNVHITALQELMRHKDIKMTLRYVHLSASHLSDAVTALD